VSKNIILVNINRFKQNSQEMMLNNFAITVQSFVAKFWKLTELLIVKFLVLKKFSSIAILA